MESIASPFVNLVPLADKAVNSQHDTVNTSASSKLEERNALKLSSVPRSVQTHELKTASQLSLDGDTTPPSNTANIYTTTTKDSSKSEPTGWKMRFSVFPNAFSTWSSKHSATTPSAMRQHSWLDAQEGWTAPSSPSPPTQIPFSTARLNRFTIEKELPHSESSSRMTTPASLSRQVSQARPTMNASLLMKAIQEAVQQTSPILYDEATNAIHAKYALHEVTERPVRVDTFAIMKATQNASSSPVQSPFLAKTVVPVRRRVSQVALEDALRKVSQTVSPRPYDEDGVLFEAHEQNHDIIERPSRPDTQYLNEIVDSLSATADTLTPTYVNTISERKGLRPLLSPDLVKEAIRKASESASPKPYDEDNIKLDANVQLHDAVERPARLNLEKLQESLDQAEKIQTPLILMTPLSAQPRVRRRVSQAAVMDALKTASQSASPKPYDEDSMKIDANNALNEALERPVRLDSKLLQGHLEQIQVNPVIEYAKPVLSRSPSRRVSKVALMEALVQVSQKASPKPFDENGEMVDDVYQLHDAIERPTRIDTDQLEKTIEYAVKSATPRTPIALRGTKSSAAALIEAVKEAVKDCSPKPYDEDNLLVDATMNRVAIDKSSPSLEDQTPKTSLLVPTRTAKPWSIQIPFIPNTIEYDDDTPRVETRIQMSHATSNDLEPIIAEQSFEARFELYEMTTSPIRMQSSKHSIAELKRQRAAEHARGLSFVSSVASPSLAQKGIVWRKHQVQPTDVIAALQKHLESVKNEGIRNVADEEDELKLEAQQLVTRPIVQVDFLKRQLAESASIIDSDEDRERVLILEDDDKAFENRIEPENDKIMEIDLQAKVELKQNNVQDNICASPAFGEDTSKLIMKLAPRPRADEQKLREVIASTASPSASDEDASRLAIVSASKKPRISHDLLRQALSNASSPVLSDEDQDRLVPHTQSKKPRISTIALKQAIVETSIFVDSDEDKSKLATFGTQKKPRISVVALKKAISDASNQTDSDDDQSKLLLRRQMPKPKINPILIKNAISETSTPVQSDEDANRMNLDTIPRKPKVNQNLIRSILAETASPKDSDEDETRLFAPEQEMIPKIKSEFRKKSSFKKLSNRENTSHPPNNNSIKKAHINQKLLQDTVFKASLSVDSDEDSSRLTLEENVKKPRVTIIALKTAISETANPVDSDEDSSKTQEWKVVHELKPIVNKRALKQLVADTASPIDSDEDATRLTNKKNVKPRVNHVFIRREMENAAKSIDSDEDTVRLSSVNSLKPQVNPTIIRKHIETLAVPVDSDEDMVRLSKRETLKPRVNHEFIKKAIENAAVPADSDEDTNRLSNKAILKPRMNSVLLKKEIQNLASTVDSDEDFARLSNSKNPRPRVNHTFIQKVIEKTASYIDSDEDTARLSSERNLLKSKPRLNQELIKKAVENTAVTVHSDEDTSRLSNVTKLKPRVNLNFLKKAVESTASPMDSDEDQSRLLSESNAKIKKLQNLSKDKSLLVDSDGDDERLAKSALLNSEKPKIMKKSSKERKMNVAIENESLTEARPQINTNPVKNFTEKTSTIHSDEDDSRIRVPNLPKKPRISHNVLRKMVVEAASPLDSDEDQLKLSLAENIQLKMEQELENLSLMKANKVKQNNLSKVSVKPKKSTKLNAEYIVESDEDHARLTDVANVEPKSLSVKASKKVIDETSTPLEYDEGQNQLKMELKMKPKVDSHLLKRSIEESASIVDSDEDSSRLQASSISSVGPKMRRTEVDSFKRPSQVKNVLPPKTLPKSSSPTAFDEDEIRLLSPLAESFRPKLIPDYLKKVVSEIASPLVSDEDQSRLELHSRQILKPKVEPKILKKLIAENLPTIASDEDESNIRHHNLQLRKLKFNSELVGKVSSEIEPRLASNEVESDSKHKVKNKTKLKIKPNSLKNVISATESPLESDEDEIRIQAFLLQTKPKVNEQILKNLVAENALPLDSDEDNDRLQMKEEKFDVKIESKKPRTKDAKAREVQAKHNSESKVTKQDSAKHLKQKKIAENAAVIDSVEDVIRLLSPAKEQVSSQKKQKQKAKLLIENETLASPLQSDEDTERLASTIAPKKTSINQHFLRRIVAKNISPLISDEDSDRLSSRNIDVDEITTTNDNEVLKSDVDNDNQKAGFQPSNKAISAMESNSNRVRLLKQVTELNPVDSDEDNNKVTQSSQLPRRKLNSKLIVKALIDAASPMDSDEDSARLYSENKFLNPSSQSKKSEEQNDLIQAVNEIQVNKRELNLSKTNAGDSKVSNESVENSRLQEKKEIAILQESGNVKEIESAKRPRVQSSLLMKAIENSASPYASDEDNHRFTGALQVRKPKISHAVIRKTLAENASPLHSDEDEQRLLKLKSWEELNQRPSLKNVLKLEPLKLKDETSPKKTDLQENIIRRIEEVPKENQNLESTEKWGPESPLETPPFMSTPTPLNTVNPFPISSNNNTISTPTQGTLPPSQSSTIPGTPESIRTASSTGIMKTPRPANETRRKSRPGKVVNIAVDNEKSVSTTDKNKIENSAIEKQQKSFARERIKAKLQLAAVQDKKPSSSMISYLISFWFQWFIWWPIQIITFIPRLYVHTTFSVTHFAFQSSKALLQNAVTLMFSLLNIFYVIVPVKIWSKWQHQQHSACIIDISTVAEEGKSPKMNNALCSLYLPRVHHSRRQSAQRPVLILIPSLHSGLFSLTSFDYASLAVELCDRGLVVVVMSNQEGKFLTPLPSESIQDSPYVGAVQRTVDWTRKNIAHFGGNKYALHVLVHGDAAALVTMKAVTGQSSLKSLFLVESVYPEMCLTMAALTGLLAKEFQATDRSLTTVPENALPNSQNPLLVLMQNKPFKMELPLKSIQTRHYTSWNWMRDALLGRNSSLLLQDVVHFMKHGK